MSERGMRMDLGGGGRQPTTSHRTVWLSLLVSALLHLLFVVLVQPFWRDIEEAEAFRARLAYRPRFEPRRLGALRPESAPASRMEQLRLEGAGADVPKLQLLPPPTAISVHTPEPGGVVVAPIPGVRPDTLALARETMASAVDYGWDDLETGEIALDLLRIEDMARADAHRAAIITSPRGPREARGFINFTPLNLYGMGSGRLRLEALARYLRDYTSILAHVRTEKHSHFLSESLLEDPVHFLFQGGGMPPWTDHLVINFSDEERQLLGRYLHEGGFLVIEGDYRYTREMTELLCSTMGPGGRLVPLSEDHAINHSYYQFGGFLERWLEEDESLPPADLCRDNLEGYRYDRGPYGAFLDDDLVAMIGGAGSRNWVSGGGVAATDSAGSDAETVEDAETDTDASVEGTATLPSLMRGVNIVSYVLHRANGLAVRRAAPSWETLPPSVAPGAHKDRVDGEGWTDAAVLNLLDASLAFVHIPMGEPIEGGLRVRFDGGRNVDVSGGSADALLVHNLKSGVHLLELSYGGESRRLEVNLTPDRVTTLAFSLRDFLVFKRLALKEQDERIRQAHWLESFQDLVIDERFAGATAE